MRDYVLTLLVTAAVTYMLTPLVRKLAARIGAMKEPRDRDVHVAPVPLIGGLAMYGGLAAGLLVASQIPQLQTGFANTGMVSGLVLAGGLLVVIGIIDDRWGLTALTKGAGQVAAGGILVATGTQLAWLPEPGGGTFVPTTVQSTALTILVVVATINAVNFIDGLDGLAAGIVCIAAISFFAYYYSLTRVIDVSSLAAPALASALLIGMCLGFLPHNFSPASVFMGDTGAMLLGLLLAYAPISSIDSLPPAQLTSQINRYPVIMPLLLPAALLLIPYADLLLAVVRRTRAGKSPFSPDRKHLHHRLLDIGHSQRASVLIMYLWAAMFSGIVVWLSIEKTERPGASNHHGVPVSVFVAVTVAAVAALLLMSMPRLRWWQRDARRQANGGPSAAPVAVTAAGTAAGPAVVTGAPAAGPAAAAQQAPELVFAVSAGGARPEPAVVRDPGHGVLPAPVLAPVPGAVPGSGGGPAPGAVPGPDTGPASGAVPRPDTEPGPDARPDPEARPDQRNLTGNRAGTDATLPEPMSGGGSPAWQTRPGPADPSPAGGNGAAGNNPAGAGAAGNGTAGNPAGAGAAGNGAAGDGPVRSVVGTVPPEAPADGPGAAYPEPLRPGPDAVRPARDAVWPGGAARWQSAPPRRPAPGAPAGQPARADESGGPRPDTGASPVDWFGSTGRRDV